MFISDICRPEIVLQVKAAASEIVYYEDDPHLFGRRTRCLCAGR